MAYHSAAQLKVDLRADTTKLDAAMANVNAVMDNLDAGAKALGLSSLRTFSPPLAGALTSDEAMRAVLSAARAPTPMLWTTGDVVTAAQWNGSTYDRSRSADEAAMAKERRYRTALAQLTPDEMFVLDRTFGLNGGFAWNPDDIAAGLETSAAEADALLTVALWKMLLLADLRRADLETRGAAARERRGDSADPFRFASGADLFGGLQPHRTVKLELAIDRPQDAPAVGSRVWFMVQDERMDGIVHSVDLATIGRDQLRTTIKVSFDDGSVGSLALFIDPKRIVRAKLETATNEPRVFGIDWSTARQPLWQPPFSDGTAPIP